MNSANLTRGAVLSGTVASVDDFYARVQLDGQLGIAYVHISQFSDGSLSPPMAAYLSVGDRLTGVVAHLSGRFGCPELSPKLLRRSGAGKSPVVSKEVEECEITKANELYTLTRTPNGPGLLTNHLGSWSRYEVLLTSGLLTEGQSLALIRTGQCDESGRWKMRFPIFPVARHDRANVTLKGEIILWRPNATRKKDQMLRNILYVHTGSGFVLRIECNDLLDITEHFSIGETIDVSLVDQPPFREIPFGTVARTETDLQRPARELQVGKKVTGKVVRLLPGGAIVLVADHCPVFLPAASVMPGKEFVGAALQCGDMLEGLVSVVNDPSAEGDK